MATALLLGGCGLDPRPEGAPEVPPSASASADGAAAARAATYARWNERARHQIASADAPELPAVDDPSVRPFAGRWPFHGLAPRPAGFPLRELPHPSATIEWRRVGGALQESHASGAHALLAEMRAHAARLENELATSGTTTMSDPAHDWSRPRDLAADDWRANLRDDWCSAWSETYEAAPGGPWLLLQCVVGGRIEVSVLGLRDGDASDSPSEGRTSRISWGHSRGGSHSTMLVSADFDANGSRDFVFSTTVSSCGMSQEFHDGVIVLIDAPTRRARVTPFESLEPSFVDLDLDGRAEILLPHWLGHVDHCTDGRTHAFWVTQLLGFEDLAVVDLSESRAIRHGAFTGRFPAFEWFAFDPENRFRPLLTDAMKESLLPLRFAKADERGH